MHGKFRPAEGADPGSFDRAFSSKLGRRTYPAAAVISGDLGPKNRRLIVRTHAALARASFIRSNFSRSLPVGFKPKLAGLFQGFEALDAGRQLAGSVRAA